MKIIKEDLDNLERVENRQTVQGIMMKDAEEQSKKSEDNFKEVAGNPEDLKKKKPFISGEKQPKPKDVETPKPELEELFFTKQLIPKQKLHTHFIDENFDNFESKRKTIKGKKYTVYKFY